MKTKLTLEILRLLTVGESVIITHTSRHGPVRWEGDVAYLLSCLKPRRFTTQKLLLVNPKAKTVVDCVRVTRIDDYPPKNGGGDGTV